jgi:hypothetical protein
MAKIGKIELRMVDLVPDVKCRSAVEFKAMIAMGAA